MALSTDSHKSQFYPVLYMVDGPCSVSPSSKNLVFNYLNVKNQYEAERTTFMAT